MKLIRLATDNNGVFKSAFGNDIILEPNSKMALLNLTFQSNYTVLGVSDKNNKITFKSNSLVAGTEATSELSPLNYGLSNYNNFFSDLIYNLNKAIADDDFQNCMSSQWNIRTYSDRKTIEFRYAPFFNPLNLGSAGGRFSLMSFKAADFFVNPADTLQKTIKKSQAGLATDNRSCAMTTNAKMSNGNGLLTARIATSVNNASGAQDNGFGICLTKTNLLLGEYENGDDIPVANRDFEMRYNRPGENYVFINDGGDEKDSGVPPVLTNGGALLDHDILYYKTQGGKLEGGVLQVGVKNYINLTTGNNWTQTGTGTTETFDEINLGDPKTQIARYRRLQPSTPALEHWWEPTSATGWNVYTGANPPVIGDTPDTTATIDLATGVITIAGTTFTPSPGSSPTTVVNGGAFRRPFFSVELKPSEDLFPYLYLRGTATDISVDTFNYSLDPWINQNFSDVVGDIGSDNDWDLTGLDSVGSANNGWSNNILNIFDGSPIFKGTGQNTFPLPIPLSWQETKTMELTLHSDIWSFLGFTNIGSGNVTKQLTIGIAPSAPTETQCWSWYIGNREVLPTNSDNYLVESMTLALDSYDASQVAYPDPGTFLNPETDKKGRRKNILMTIPVNDNSDNLVEYEASTPIFIDINNAEKLNQKNLNFRILNKNFDPIEQSGDTAIMTILIAKENE